MASSGERRLVFDTRGKRKHVVRVVYAILALLMGGSLFLVIGPVNIGELLGSSSTGSSAAKVFDEQAERIEKKLVANPNDEQQLLALTRARINGGNSQIEVTSETEAPTVTTGAREDFEAASQAWNRYLKQAGDEANPSAAQLVAGTFFRLAESSSSLLEAGEKVAQAEKAQQIAAEQRPNINSLSTLAIYQYFNSEFDTAEKTTKQAAAKATSKAEAKSVEEQLALYRKNAKKFEKQKQALAKVQKEVGKERLQNPLGGLGGGVGGSFGE
jgi:hypothetical protein